MRNLFVFNLITLDGFFAGTKGEIDWHNVDEEFNDFSIEQLSQIGTLLFGRVTYDLMYSYWPTPQALNDDPTVAKAMNRIPKVVFSKKLEKVEWENTTLIKENIVEEVKKLKQKPGKDIAIFGSGTIVQLLTDAGLIDEYRLIVNPVILGKGKLLFKDVKKLRLKLLETKIFKSGNVLLCYRR
jgi:dihydrofolate reductase